MSHTYSITVHSHTDTHIWHTPCVLQGPIVLERRHADKAVTHFSVRKTISHQGATPP
uniref:Uncharacterized protein n=1 Tax=Anguilla anguilla TaxID=7936 RepID=A0A0E9UHL7_ANGAN